MLRSVTLPPHLHAAPISKFFSDCAGQIDHTDHTSMVWSACQEPEDTVARHRSTPSNGVWVWLNVHFRHVDTRASVTTMTQHAPVS